MKAASRMIKMLEGLRDICDLFIFDVNGVLDNQYAVKRKLIQKYSNSSNEHLISQILIDIEKIYESKKNLSFENTLIKAFKRSDLPLKRKMAKRLEYVFLKKNRISSELIAYIKVLSKGKKVVLYTSLSSSQIEKMAPLSFFGLKEIFVFSQDDFKEEKPSLANLKIICEAMQMSARKAVLIGDNVISDLMPAKMLGMRTILVSPYADYLLSDQ